MKIKLLKHDIILSVKSFDKKTKIITVNLFGTLCNFRSDEYEVIES